MTLKKRVNNETQALKLVRQFLAHNVDAYHRGSVVTIKPIAGGDAFIAMLGWTRVD